MKEDDRQKDCLVGKEVWDRESEERKNRQPCHRRKDDLAGMEAERCAGVQISISVVDCVEAPQKGNPVVEAVPEVLPRIENHDRGDQGCPSGEINLVEEAELPLTRPQCDREGSCGENQRDDEGVEHPQHEIREVVSGSALSSLEHRDEPLEAPEER